MMHAGKQMDVNFLKIRYRQILGEKPPPPPPPKKTREQIREELRQEMKRRGIPCISEDPHLLRTEYETTDAPSRPAKFNDGPARPLLWKADIKYLTSSSTSTTDDSKSKKKKHPEDEAAMTVRRTKKKDKHEKQPSTEHDEQTIARAPKKKKKEKEKQPTSDPSDDAGTTIRIKKKKKEKQPLSDTSDDSSASIRREATSPAATGMRIKKKKKKRARKLGNSEDSSSEEQSEEIQPEKKASAPDQLRPFVPPTAGLGSHPTLSSAPVQAPPPVAAVTAAVPAAAAPKIPLPAPAAPPAKASVPVPEVKKIESPKQEEFKQADYEVPSLTNLTALPPPPSAIDSLEQSKSPSEVQRAPPSLTGSDVLDPAKPPVLAAPHTVEEPKAPVVEAKAPAETPKEAPVAHQAPSEVPPEVKKEPVKDAPKEPVKDKPEEKAGPARALPLEVRLKEELSDEEHKDKEKGVRNQKLGGSAEAVIAKMLDSKSPASSKILPVASESNSNRSLSRESTTVNGIVKAVVEDKETKEANRKAFETLDDLDAADQPPPQPDLNDGTSRLLDGAVYLLKIAHHEKAMESAMTEKENDILAKFFAGMLAYNDKILVVLNKALDKIVEWAMAKKDLKIPQMNFFANKNLAKKALLDALMSHPQYLPSSWKTKFQKWKEEARKELYGVNFWRVLTSFPKQRCFDDSPVREDGTFTPKQRAMLFGVVFGPSDQKTFEETAREEASKGLYFTPAIAEAFIEAKSEVASVKQDPTKDAGKDLTKDASKEKKDASKTPTTTK